MKTKLQTSRRKFMAGAAATTLGFTIVPSSVLARPAHLALPGHRRPFTGLPARLDELVRHQHAALERLQGFLAEPRLASDCFETLYGRRIGKAEYGLALAEAVGHLNHLRREGYAVREAGPDGTWLWRRSREAAEISPDIAGASG